MSSAACAKGEVKKTFASGLYCKSCGKRFELSVRSACDECFAPVEVRYDEASVAESFTKESVSHGPQNIWRYWPLLPVSLSEGIRGTNPGMTPLRECQNLASELGVKRVLVKDDTVNPTYSFKDRPVATSIPKAIEFGLKGVGCASTGNLAGATAASAAKYRVPCYVLIPHGLERNKVLSASAYGASVIEVKGTYDTANRLANLIADRYSVGFVNVNLRPYYVEGSKTLAMEVVEQLGWQEPDRMIVPMGSGALLTAVGKGISELSMYGLSSGSCMISGTQPEGCSPISSAYETGEVLPVEKPKTVAESLAIGDPASGDEALGVIRGSGGFADAPTDSEIVEGQLLLAREEGIFTEPAGGTVIASLRRRIDDGTIRRDETVVCLITGNGLKMPSHLESSIRTSVVGPDLREVEQVFRSGL